MNNKPRPNFFERIKAMINGPSSFEASAAYSPQVALPPPEPTPPRSAFPLVLLLNYATGAVLHADGRVEINLDKFREALRNHQFDFSDPNAAGELQKERELQAILMWLVFKLARQEEILDGYKRDIEQLQDNLSRLTSSVQSSDTSNQRALEDIREDALAADKRIDGLRTEFAGLQSKQTELEGKQESTEMQSKGLFEVLSEKISGLPELVERVIGLETSEAKRKRGRNNNSTRDAL